jgi:2-succinyl-5-enolpyruvyl-6-hydroxy-3-cyclohexene-1-carboxylate synthase
VVVGDATLRGAIAYADPILRADDIASVLRPDVVVRAGGLVASKVLARRLIEWRTPVIAVAVGGPVADPDRVVGESVGEVTGSDDVDGTHDYLERWRRASAAVGDVLSDLDVATSALTEPAVARAVVAGSERHRCAAVIGSSMPFRDVEWWTPSRRERVYANRGVNGIDGVTSTALGVAVDDRAIGLVGDVTFLHDVSGLTDGVGTHGGVLALVVVDNGGGGIFSFLPQAEYVPAEQFERLFTTPRRHDLPAIAQAFGHGATEVSSRGELDDAIDRALTGTGLHVIVARVSDVADNVVQHDRLNEAAMRALRAADL